MAYKLLLDMFGRWDRNASAGLTGKPDSHGSYLKGSATRRTCSVATTGKVTKIRTVLSSSRRPGAVKTATIQEETMHNRLDHWRVVTLTRMMARYHRRMLAQMRKPQWDEQFFSHYMNVQPLNDSPFISTMQ